MKPSWVTKTDPVHHPVRFLGSIWQKQMKIKFGVPERQLTAKEYGQLKCLRQQWGDLTQDVIEWVVDPVNWWHISQEVRQAWKTRFVPKFPDIGFLLGRRAIALRVIRSKLGEPSANAELVKKLDEKDCHRLRNVMLRMYAEDPELVSKITNAKNRADLEQLLSETKEKTNGDTN